MSDVKVFALSVAVLYVKFQASTLIQDYKAFEAERQGAPSRRGAVNSFALDAKRWKRIVESDLESMPLAFAVFWSAIVVGVSPTITTKLLVAYTAARIGHTAIYSADTRRNSSACSTIGTFCVVAAAVSSAIVALME